MTTPRRIIRNVPCGTCTACCRGHRDALEIHPEHDNALDYKTKLLGGKLVLDWKENGDCAHLTDKGCGVWDKRPIVCKEFDCREVFSWPLEARQYVNEAVKAAARRLLRKEGKL